MVNVIELVFNELCSCIYFVLKTESQYKGNLTEKPHSNHYTTLLP